MITSFHRLRHVAIALIGALLVSAASAQTFAQITPPAGNRPAMAAFAVGVQIYVAAPNPANPSQLIWVFQAPQATLYNFEGEQVATHFAGPRWQANDGSIVRGAKIGSMPSPDPNSIPWLLLQAVEHVGSGDFDDVTYIQRLFTVRGTAPTTAPTAVGQIANTPYAAIYVFYKASHHHG